MHIATSASHKVRKTLKLHEKDDYPIVIKAVGMAGRKIGQHVHGQVKITRAPAIVHDGAETSSTISLKLRPRSPETPSTMP